MITYTLNINHKVFQLALQPGLGLLQTNDLGIGGFSSLLSLLQFGLQLASATGTKRKLSSKL